jgi:PAS domain-containing protein
MKVPEAICEAPGAHTPVSKDAVATGAALTAHEAQLQFDVGNAPVYLARFDRGRRFKFVNEGYARRFGLSPAQVVGWLISEVIGTAAYEVVRSHVEAALAGREVEFEAAIPYPQLGIRVMHCGYHPEVDAPLSRPGHSTRSCGGLLQPSVVQTQTRFTTQLPRQPTLRSWKRWFTGRSDPRT